MSSQEHDPTVPPTAPGHADAEAEVSGYARGQDGGCIPHPPQPSPLPWPPRPFPPGSQKGILG
jgi:hypothetical protein